MAHSRSVDWPPPLSRHTVPTAHLVHSLVGQRRQLPAEGVGGPPPAVPSRGRRQPGHLRPLDGVRQRLFTELREPGQRSHRLQTQLQLQVERLVGTGRHFLQIQTPTRALCVRSGPMVRLVGAGRHLLQIQAQLTVKAGVRVEGL